MDSGKVCFILCSDDEVRAQECESHIQQLNVPDGFETDILIVQGAESMCSGYNEAMRASDAKYKVYLHQDVSIVNRSFIFDMLLLFLDNPDIGVLGVAGNESQDVFPKIQGEYQEVFVLDGFLMATQYDIPWREDLFRGWDYYDYSQSLEFCRAGYKAVVPEQYEPWCLYDNKILAARNDGQWRQVFLNEYNDLIEKWNEKAGRPMNV